MKIDIYEFMEDFDNPELERYEWEDRMADGVDEYYRLFPETPPMKIGNRIRNYHSWKREKYAPEQ